MRKNGGPSAVLADGCDRKIEVPVHFAVLDEERKFHGLARRTGSPHGDRAVALQDHMVREGRREGERPIRGGRHCGDARGHVAHQILLVDHAVGDGDALDGVAAGEERGGEEGGEDSGGFHGVSFYATALRPASMDASEAKALARAGGLW